MNDLKNKINKSYSIRVYNSHIEVYPYEKEECVPLERHLSKWDEVTHSYERIGYYVSNSILYLPRGISMTKLANWFNATPIVVGKADPSSKLKTEISMKYQPKDRIQEESIRFLTSEGEFRKGMYYSQFGLNLDTGDGKTYCMIHAIALLNMKAIIITHKTRIKEQWVSEFLSKTDISEERILSIEGSEDVDKIMSGQNEADIYVVNHQTISTYGRLYGWEKIRSFFKKIRVGIKVIDEAHKHFENTLMIDFFSNVKRSYYLTATFTRSDPKEITIYNRAFASVYRFGEETLMYEEKRKHIILTAVIYRSQPSVYQVKKIVGGAYGFNSYRYIDYTLKDDPYNTMMKVIKMIINKTESLEGKTLITSPKIESVEMIADQIKGETNKSVGVVHSHQSKEENDNSIKKDIISSTIKGIGEGDDIRGLRILINTEPIGSKALVDQLRGRLREYSSDKDTYIFYLIDGSIGYTLDMFKRIRPVFEKKCKEIHILKLDNI